MKVPESTVHMYVLDPVHYNSGWLINYYIIYYYIIRVLSDH